MPDLLFEKRDGVAWITFNRPEAKNALSPEAFFSPENLGALLGGVGMPAEAVPA